MKKLYDWEKWFARPRFTLRRGRDYLCSAGTMVQQVRNAASLRGLSICIDEYDDRLVVSVRQPAVVSGGR